MSTLRTRWHVVAGDTRWPTILVDCDTEARAHALAGLYGRRHTPVRVVKNTPGGRSGGDR